MDARTNFFYGAAGITPAIAMRLQGIGSQYLPATTDASRDPFDGAGPYNMTRSMLGTPQRYPRADRRRYPSPADEPNADGSATVYFGPAQPAGVQRSNWIETLPGKGWFAILRLFGPLEPLFDKNWRPSEIEPASLTSPCIARARKRPRRGPGLAS